MKIDSKNSEKTENLENSTEKNLETLKINLQNTMENKLESESKNQPKTELKTLKKVQKTVHLLGIFNNSNLEVWANLITKYGENGGKTVLHLITENCQNNHNLENVEMVKSELKIGKIWKKLESFGKIKKFENQIYLGSLCGRKSWESNILTYISGLFCRNEKNNLIDFWLKTWNENLDFNDNFIITKSTNLQRKPNFGLIESQINYLVEFRSENYGETENTFLLHIFSFLENFGEFGNLEESHSINKNDLICLVNCNKTWEKFEEILGDLNDEFELNLEIIY